MSIDDAKLNVDTNKTNDCDSHYMTIIGYTKYNKDNDGYGFILKVVSWGMVYYINYDQFADVISPFTNIFEIK